MLAEISNLKLQLACKQREKLDSEQQLVQAQVYSTTHNKGISPLDVSSERDWKAATTRT